MQTQMAQALVAAGVKPKPLMERVWHYIRDNPNANLAKVESVYGPSSKQTIHSLYCRKMLTRRIEERRIGGGRVRSIYLYKVAMQEYELLPLPAKPKDWVPKTKSPPAPAQAPAAAMAAPLVPAKPVPTPAYAPNPAMPVPTPAAPTPTPAPCSGWPASYVDGLKVSDARLLYAHLKALFG